MSQTPYQFGDLVIYRKPKISTHPGPRAKNIHPTPHGDDYIYQVDKYWLVLEIQETGDGLTVLTRTGKRHFVSTDDPNLRHANWWERWLYQNRFPSLPEQAKSEKNVSEKGTSHLDY